MTVEELNEVCRNTLIEHLEIRFTDFGADFITAQMPVNSKKHQPTGVLHGGASLALAETVGSAGSFLLVNPSKYNVFGMQVSANHVATISSGLLIAKAEINHLGRKTHVWDVKITDENNKLISVARVTNIITEKQED